MKTFLITGATGQQGLATLNHLLSSPDGRVGQIRIHATVRDPSSASAVALAAIPGVTVFPFKDFFDFEAFRAAAKVPSGHDDDNKGRGIAGLFLNLIETPDVTAQETQARGILEAVRPGSVVYASAFGTGDKALWEGDAVQGFFEGHWRGENFIRAHATTINIPYTILRPFWIMSNYLPPASSWSYPELSSASPPSNPTIAASPSPGKRYLVTSLDPSTRTSLVSPDDIGRFAAAALLSPAKFSGQELSLGKDNLTPEEMARVVSEVSGIEVGVVRRARSSDGKEAKEEGEGVEKAELTEERAMIQAFEQWTNRLGEGGGDVDGAALEKRFGIPVVGFREYLEGRKGELIKMLGGE